MIPKDQVIIDNCSDPIGGMLAELHAIPHWNKEAASLLALVIKKLNRAGYVKFEGHYQHYRVSKIGRSILYQVPSNRRGHLCVFRGRLVRVVSLGRAKPLPLHSFAPTRVLMVGICDKSQIGVARPQTKA